MRTRSAQVVALHNVRSKLEYLGKAFASGRAARIASLNRFESDETLGGLERLLAEQHTEFDALDFVGQLSFGSGRDLWGQEEFHSNMLGWLLDPNQSHGHSDLFLKDFLKSADAPLTEHSHDWTETEVIREWPHVVDGQQGFLDVLIVNKAQQFLCAIENKVFSFEHSNQLTRYRKALKDHYPAFTRHHVFLTPQGELASQEEDQGYWIPLMYSEVSCIVQQILEYNESSTDENVRAFLRQYATTLRRNIMPETSLTQQARKIYLEHREAIDLIAANKPDYMADTMQWLKEAIEQQPEWKLDIEVPKSVRFLSTNWDRYEAAQTSSHFSKPSAIVFFEFGFVGKREFPLLGVKLRPETDANHGLRQMLFEAVRQHPRSFRPKTTILRSGWATLHEENSCVLDESDYGIGWDDGTSRDKIQDWVARFAEEKFPTMNDVIVNCLHEYESGKQG
ncbi:MAG: hypothetical protein F4Y49_08245 [Dehalococcoidia bacterium]|nr:hypothetical protein [Dehalococcoidia bacterium]